MKEKLFLNGEFVSSQEAKAEVYEPGFLYGIGTFETMRAYQGKIVSLDAHLERIKSSSKAIGIKVPYAPGKLKEAIRAIVKINSLSDARVRMTFWKTSKGSVVLIAAEKYRPHTAAQYRKGFSACVSSLRQSDPALAMIKSTNRLLYELSMQEAKAKGADEAIILNHDNYITEACRSNLFFAKDGKLFTPALECGCLNGVTRRIVLDLSGKLKIPVQEGSFTIQDLYRAEEAFLTNSLMGVMPLASLEKIRIGKGIMGKTAQSLLEKYRVLLRHGN